MDRLFLSVEDCAKALSLGRSLTWQLVARGELKSLKVGRRRLVSAQSLLEYARKLEEEAVTT